MRRHVVAPVRHASTSRKWIISAVTLVAVLTLAALPAYASASRRHWDTYATARSTKHITTQPVKAASSWKNTKSSGQPKPVTTTVAPTSAATPVAATVAPTTVTVSPAPVTSTAPSTPAATSPMPTTVQPSQLCMNYGHQPTQNGSYSWSQVDTHIAVMKKAGINCLRLAYYGFDNTDLRELALRAKAAGMYVIVGGTWDTLDASELAAYDAKALGQAKWAQANGIPQLGIGNEQEYRLSGITQAQWQQHVLELAAKVRQVYSGKISYELSSDHLGTWYAGGLGSLDLIGLNAYCGLACNESRLKSAVQAFGTDHVYVSETNSDMNTGKYNTDQAHADALKQDLLVTMQHFPGIRFYYFAFISGGSAPDHWGLYNPSGTTLVQPLSAAVLGIK